MPTPPLVYKCACGFTSVTATAFYRHLAQLKGEVLYKVICAPVRLHALTAFVALQMLLALQMRQRNISWYKPR